MKTFVVILVGIAVVLILYVEFEEKIKSLEKENKGLKTEIKNLNETLDKFRHRNAQLLNTLTDSNDKPSGKIYLGGTSRDTGYSLKVGDEFSSQPPTAQQGVILSFEESFSSLDEVEDRFARSGWVVTFEPGGSSTRGQYTYSSPNGATLHLDANNRITNIVGTVYRR